MSNTSAQGTQWTSPNVPGSILFTPSAIKTPFLDACGTPRIVHNTEFNMGVNYAHETLAQTSFTETNLITAATALTFNQTAEYNAVQPYHSTPSLTDMLNSTYERLIYTESGSSGYAYSVDPNNGGLVPNPWQFQIAKHLEQCKRWWNWHALNGTYNIATSAATANQMGGVLAVSTTNTVSAGGHDLTDDMFTELFDEMATSGAFDIGGSFVILCNSHNRQMISKNLYGYAPPDRTAGGVSIDRVYTDFGVMPVLYDRHCPAATIGIINVGMCHPVILPILDQPTIDGYIKLLEVPGYGGKSADMEFFASIDYGSIYFHGTITSTATA
jgi:hypothetical protein